MCDITLHYSYNNMCVNFICPSVSMSIRMIMYKCSHDISAGPKGITCLMVEKGTPGMSFGAKEKKVSELLCIIHNICSMMYCWF